MIKYLGAGCDAGKFSTDTFYRESLLKYFNCLYPQNAFKFDCTVTKELKFNFERRDAFLAFLNEARLPKTSYRINCIFWDFSMKKRLELIPCNNRWAFIKEWLLNLLEPVQGCIGCDLVNEPFRLERGRVIECRTMLRLLGKDWIEHSLDLFNECRPDLPLFINQHYIGYKPIQDALRVLVSRLSINVSLQITTSSFGVNKFDNLNHFIDSLPKEVHVPEVTVWRWKNKIVPSELRQMQYWAKKQEFAYLRIIEMLLKSKTTLVGFWEPCLGRSFYYQDESPGFLSIDENVIKFEKLKSLLEKVQKT